MSTNVSGEKVGEIFAEIGIKFDKLDADFKKVESLGRKTAEKMEFDFKKLRLDLDNRLATMKIGEVKKYYEALKIQMDQKLKFNTDTASLEKTAVGMDAARTRMKQFGTEGEVTGHKISAAFTKIATAVAAFVGIRKIFNFTKEGLFDSTQLKDLQEGFEGTARDIELMKKATAGMVDDGDLLELSNQAAGYNVKIKDQPILFLLAAKAAKSMGGTITQGFDAIIRATDGMTRGVGKLVGGRAALNQEVERLARLEGGKLSDLDAETQKRIKIQAIINASHLSMADVEKNQATQNQQLQALPALIHNVKEAWGSMFASILSGMPFVMKGLKDLARNFREVAQGRAANAVETVTRDFTGTTKEQRDKMIQDWQKQADELNKKVETQQKKRENYATSTLQGGGMLDNSIVEDFKKEQNTYEIQKATFNKLIELARKYKEVKEEPAGGLSAEALNERAEKAIETANKIAQEQLDQDNDLLKQKEENIAKYYEEVKFKDEDYFDWKADLILREISTEKIKNEKLKKLVDDRYEYERDKGTDPSLRGKTAEQLFDEMTNGGGGSSASNKALYNRSHQKKRMAAMKEEAAAAANLGQTMASAFSIANMQGKNMAQIFADMGSRFADMIVQALAFKLIMAGLNAIPGVGSFLSLIGIGAHNGGEFVGTSSGVMKMAGGGSFMVPGGFPNDSFGPMFFETGEKVSVTPASQVNNNFSDRAMVNELQGIRSSIHSLTKITLQHREVISNLYLDSKLLATSVTQKQNEFERSNIKVNR